VHDPLLLFSKARVCRYMSAASINHLSHKSQLPRLLNNQNTLPLFTSKTMLLTSYDRFFVFFKNGNGERTCLRMEGRKQNSVSAAVMSACRRFKNPQKALIMISKIKYTEIMVTTYNTHLLWFYWISSKIRDR
jgi:hypothetical protein